MRSVVCVAAFVCGASAVVAADTARVKTGKLDVWDGPFASIADATASDLSPATELPPFDDDQTLPADLPIEALVALRREMVACASDKLGGCGAPAGEHLQYRLAARTKAGWFTSGQLGISQNRNRCYFTAVSGDTSRFRILYKCDVGRFDWASKDFLLLCGVDATGRPACGRTVVGAQHNVHRGGKSDSATDVIHDTLSCEARIDGDTVKLVARKIKQEASDDSTPRTSRLAKCGGHTRFELDQLYSPGSHERPPLFDESGRWLP